MKLVVVYFLIFLVTAEGGCGDNNKQCPAWSSRGECEKNPAYMLVNCRKSCKLCTEKHAIYHHEFSGYHPPIVRNKLYEYFEVPFLGKEFLLKFEFFINKITEDPWQNVIHLTTGGNVGKMGDRIPGVWVTKRKELWVMFAINGKGDFSKSVGKVEENKLIKLEISQRAIRRQKVLFGDNGFWKYTYWRYLFDVLLNDKSVWLVENSTPRIYEKPKIYMGDPWHPALHGSIRSLTIRSTRCPPEWKGMGHGCYYAEERKMNFREAQDFCKAKNASVILAIEEKERQKLTKEFADFTRKKLRFWIDAKWVAGTYMTGNGKKILTSAASWGDGDRTGNCVRSGPDFKWYKAGCDSKGEAHGYTWNPMCKMSDF